MDVKGKRGNSEFVIVLLLFFTYAICALAICVLGANSYSQTVAVVQEGFNQRTGVLYIAQKVRQNDIGGGVRVDTYNDGTALVLTEQQTGQGFETWIFVKDGFLCEQQIQAGTEIVDDQAQRIMPMRMLALSFSEEDLLKVALITETGSVNTTNIAVRSSGDSFNKGNTPPASALAAQEAAQDGLVIMNPPANQGGVS